jgi:hypothetical protein
MNEDDAKSHSAKIVRGQLEQPAFRIALRSRYRPIANDGPMDMTLRGLDEAEASTGEFGRRTTSELKSALQGAGPTSNLPFHQLTIMTDHPGRMRNIASVHEAAEFLVQHWLVGRGQKFRAAQQACLDALAGRKTAKHARAAFIAAAKEADIYVREQRP